ncbi:aldose epimerase [Corynebacterium sp. 320]|uniref:aldose epimerase family protein n=1 Tax=Corynebacterium TaxID=1716 RepID=UPI00125CBBC0|nr:MULTISPECIES: aldose epimerase [Corynebacterium]KAB1503060.1 aldose epimerase [Corynebacterium sp. 320]KAB1550729.1 aldose epimerase [Corynebacterium sp. 321]KAB1551088.1 aldose epimerase [Corynebacterium sp. 319]KAB3526857.1 aldose epimerase [Corynebacterium sp. 250]KAB3538350.1 aldose epimerase [Corynebacterium sp. 366]
MTAALPLVAGDYRATIDPVGAGLHSLTFQGRDLVVSYDIASHAPGSPAPHSSGAILAPWPNRTADARFTWAGHTHELPMTEAQRRNALHGLVLDKRWDVEEHRAASIALTCSIGSPWPWPLHMRATYALDAADGLSVTLAITNQSDEDCPVGVGFHPYLSAMGAPLDSSKLTIGLGECVELEPNRLLPTGRRLPATQTLPAAAQGLAQPMAGIQLDHCYEGALGVVYCVNDNGEGVSLHPDPALRYFQIFTADPQLGHGYPGVGRALAVEPQTCPPDMLNTGEGLRTLCPAETLTTGYRLRAIHPSA